MLTYGVLFMQVGERGSEKTPFDGVRAWYKEQMGGFGSSGGERGRGVRERDEQSPIAEGQKT